MTMDASTNTFRSSTTHRLFNMLVLVLIVLLPLMNVVLQTGSAQAAGNAAGKGMGAPPAGNVQVLVTFQPGATQAQITAALNGSGGQPARLLDQIHTQI